MTVNLPIRISSPQNGSQGASRRATFARANDRAKQRQTVKDALDGITPHALPCVVILTRIASRELDSDGCAAGFKAVRDQVAAWLGIDDRDPRVTFHVAQAKGVPREFSCRITVRGRCDWDDQFDRIRNRVLGVAA